MPFASLKESCASYEVLQVAKSFTLCLATTRFCGVVMVVFAGLDGVEAVVLTVLSLLVLSSVLVVSLLLHAVRKSIPAKKLEIPNGEDFMVVIFFRLINKGSGGSVA